jgi:plasmid maintenance system antidote protein VapI
MASSKELIAISPEVLKRWVLSETNKKTGGKTQTQFAEALGFKQATISGWVVSGRDYLPQSTITAIAKYRKESYEQTLRYLQQGIDNHASISKQDQLSRIETLEKKVESQGQTILDILAALRTTGDEIKKLKSSKQRRSSGANDVAKFL